MAELQLQTTSQAKMFAAGATQALSADLQPVGVNKCKQWHYYSGGGKTEIKLKIRPAPEGEI